ncbi:hypothetical protein GCM10023185_43920 [Hymenobacter saemangeumensis]|uniref:DUF433 domain-containing protein n=1 Tax=Hymenobacter saemangeumensis TaxID=1084522 RepID=A0ABP8ISJ9_9BACT
MPYEIIDNPPAFTPAEQSDARWNEAKQQLPLGTTLSGKIFARAPFGVFYDAGVGFPVLMEILDLDTHNPGGLRFPGDYPALNSVISGEVSGFRENNRQIQVVKDYAALINPDLAERLRYQEEGRLPDHPLISIHPKVRLGFACLIGTQISVIDVLDWLAGSLSIDSTIAAFPGLTMAMVSACLQYAADREKHVRPAGW